MKIQSLLDSMYLVPIVLEHLERPTEITTRVMGEYQISERDAREMKALLEYHYKTVLHYFNFPEGYPLLRKGLNQYFNRYLVAGYERITEKLPDWDSVHMLHFGSG